MSFEVKVVGVYNIFALEVQRKTKSEEDGSSETSSPIYQTTRRHISGECAIFLTKNFEFWGLEPHHTTNIWSSIPTIEIAFLSVGIIV